VVRLVARGGVKIEAGIPERYAGEIGLGTQVQVTPNAYAAEARGGRVIFVGAAINPQTRTFPIEVAVDNAEGALKPAMVVRLGVTRAVLENAISVPQEAIVRDERGTSVFVATDGPTGAVVARRVVELGPSSGADVVVLSGVEPGDQIIVSGQSGLSEGDAVRVSRRRTASVAAPAPVASRN
jgi:membrane fusion protein (multidrug efflux system)